MAVARVLDGEIVQAELALHLLELVGGRVLERDPDVDTRKIGAALAQDPVLTAKVLRLANSAFFGGQRSMASIDAAVALIGIQALNRLIVACGVSSSFKEIPGLDLRVFWRDA